MDDYGYYGGAEPAWLIASLLAFSFFLFVFALAAYIVNAIFLMKLLKNAGHRTPIAAWVPIWNTVALMQIGGIKQPWIWALIFVGGSLVAGMIPYIGFFISLGILVAAIIVTIYLAKGVQAGVGKESTGGIVLAVLLPIIWVIWISLASDKSNYDREAAIREGSKMPWNWFGESDLYEPFGVTAPAAAGSYQQPQGYAPPQGGYAPAPQPPQSYGPPAPAYAPPVAPEAPVAPAPAVPTYEPPVEETASQDEISNGESWKDDSAAPATSAYTPPVAPGSENAADESAPEVTTTPPAPPRPSIPHLPRSREELEEGDGNRII